MSPVARSNIAEPTPEYIHPIYVRLARSANSTLALQSRSRVRPLSYQESSVCCTASSVHAVVSKAVVAGLGEVRQTVRVLADLDPMQDVTVRRIDHGDRRPK